MNAEYINRRQVKAETRALLKTAQIAPRTMVIFYLGLSLLLNFLSTFDIAPAQSFTLLPTFISILIYLMNTVLSAGFVLYCMAIRRGERAEFLTLFDGFSFAGKIIALNVVMYMLIFLWSMLFVFPGIVAYFRYRFALYNLYENPNIGIFEALNMSKRQTRGYKLQLLALDVSYFGWFLLASIPSLVETFLYYQEYAAAFFGSAAATISPVNFTHSVLPSWGWLLFIGLWALVVGLFYLPHYQCAELRYFEIAKTTSGVTQNTPPWENPWNCDDKDDTTRE